MSKKLSILAILLVATSCLSDKEFYKQDQQEVPDIAQEMVIEEAPFQPIQNEQQAEQINEEVKINEEISIETVEVPDRVFFAFDSSHISDEATKALDIQAQWLAHNPQITITIEGHCDERGTREYNLALGQRRATATQKYLISKGIETNRIKTISYGKEKPAYFGTSEAIHAKNRRAVVIVRD